MSSAASTLIGRHNFSAFRAEDKSRPDESPIVVVEDAGIETEGDLIVFRITASILFGAWCAAWSARW